MLGDLHDGTGPGDGFLGRQGSPILLHGQVEPYQLGGHPVQVVRVVDTDADFHQPPSGGTDELELLATVHGGERIVASRRGEPELGLVGRGVLDIGDADGDRRQPMHSHQFPRFLLGHPTGAGIRSRCPLQSRRRGDQTSGVIFSSLPTRALP